MRKSGLFYALVILFFISLANASFAIESADELRDKIEAQAKNIDSINKEIANYQNQLDQLSKSKNTLSNAIQTLTIESKKLDANVKATESKITKSKLTIESLGGSIRSAEDRITILKNGIGKGIREINYKDDTNLIELLTSSDPMATYWQIESEQNGIFKSIFEKKNELSTKKTSLESNKKEVEKVVTELNSLKSDLKSQQSINNKTKTEKNSLLSQTKNQESAYQKLVQQKLDLKKQMESDLADYQDKLKYVLNPGSLPKEGSHPLAWPLDKIYITQYFGKSVSAKRLYTSGSHNGVDLRASIGTPVRAMAPGTVIDSGNTDLTCKGASYGNWILIQYNNGLSSVYGHLSLVKSADGTKVNTGDIVAYSGGTGYATGPHLHISLFPDDAVKVASFPSTSCRGKIYTMPVAATNAYLDPMLYLPKY